MSKKKVAIVYGGKSVEHEISISSARNIFQYIDKSVFEVSIIGISKEGHWYFMNEVTSDFSNSEILTLQLSSGSATFFSQNQQVTPDIVFPVLHGTDGEDGSVQGLLQTIDLPFAGSGVLGSAVSMSKLASKRLLKAADIPTSKFITYTYQQKNQVSFHDIEKKLGLPFMAKAANLGSSVGIVKVNNEQDFESALEECFKFDTVLLFEQYIQGRELECSVMGNDDKIRVSLPAEIVISPDYEFYTYKAKYEDPNAVALKVPADIEDDIASKIRNLSIRAYQALHCEDFARVDLFLTKEGKVFINEINTIPGFTNSSMFPMMWQEQGISFTDLITIIIASSFQKFQESKRLQKNFAKQ